MKNLRRNMVVSAALVLFGAAEAFCAPAAPVLLIPFDQSVTSNKTPTLDWSDVAGSTYALQIATMSDFSTLTISSNVMSSSSYTVTVGQTLTRGTTYYWRVRASDATGDGPYTSSFTFHVSLNRVSYALNVDTMTSFNTSVLLTQQIVSPDFITPTTNQYMLTAGQGLNNATTYYWRVSATDNAGNVSGFFVPTSSFVVAGLPKPVLATPADQKRLISLTPLLKWNSVAGAASYTAYISTKPDFSLLYVTSANISGTQYPVAAADNLQNLTTYYWSVAATNGVSTSVSMSNAFYLETVSTSTLIFPEDQRVTSSKNPAFQWGVPGGISGIRDLAFTLEWATNPNMVTGLASQTAISTDNYTLTVGQALTRGTTYYWRVKTVDNVGTTFVASSQALHVSLNRVSYALDVDTMTSFNTSVLLSQQIISPDFITPTTNQYTLTAGQGLSNATTYYWRVKATDNAGNASAYFVPTSSFVVAGLPKPVLATPANQKRLISLTPLLTWSSVAGATAYTAYISTKPDFSLLYVTSANISGTQYPVAPLDNLQNLTTYYWSVAATNGVSTSVSVSNAFYLETVSTSSLVFPEDQRVTSSKNPAFQWGVPGGISGIRDLTFTLEWATNSNMVTGLASQTAISTDNYTLTVGQALTRGTTYYWRVKTVDSAGTALVASTQTLHVSLNRVSYALDVDTMTSFNTAALLSQQIISPDFITPTTNQYTLTAGQGLSNATTYYWRVKATDNAGNVSGYFVPTSSFVVAGLPKPVLVTPADQKRLISVTPLLKWSSVAGAASYTAYISTKPDFSLLYVTSANISGTQYPVAPLDNLQNLTTYYWSVAATNGVSTSVSVNNAFYLETVSTSSLVFPEDQRVTSSKNPAFQWGVPGGISGIRDLTFTLEWATNPNMVTGLASQTAISTDNYTLTVGQALTRGTTYYWRVKTVDSAGTALVASTQTLHVSLNRVSYALDVDTMTSFNTAALLSQQIVSPDFITPTTNQYTLTPGQALSNATTYYWRVKATDNAGNASAYFVPTSSFVVAGLPKPVLATPVDQKRLISVTPLLTWNSVAGAASYTAYISTKPDFSLLSVASANISGTQYPVAALDNLQNLTTYYWSVAATNGVSTSVSVSNAFYLETVSTSTLIFPEDQRVTSSKKPTFQWAVPGGISGIRDLTFTLEWATTPTMAGAQAQTGVSTNNYTLNGVQTLTRGTTYYWRVKTVDSAGTALVASTQAFAVSSNTVVYTLHIDTTTGAGPLNYNSTFTATTHVLSAGEALPNLGNYYWRVAATDRAGNSATSTPDSTFSVRVLCPVTKTVCAQGCGFGTIQSAVDSFLGSLSAYSCVYIQDSSVYGEQVTVRNFTTGGSSITILADPSLGAAPVVSPPANSTAAFVIANASVNIQGINIVPTNAMAFGVAISSAYVTLSSVSVQDAGGKIGTAGVMTSSWTTVSYTRFTGGGTSAAGFLLPGSTMTSVSDSSASVNSGAGYALWFVGGASSNTVARSTFSNAAGGGAGLDAGSNDNQISQSVMTSGGLGSSALYLSGASGNSIAQSFMTNASGYGAYLYAGSNSNAISLSTMTSGGAGYYALYLGGASSNSFNGDYVQGSTAAYATNSGGTVFGGSVLLATATTGSALQVDGSSFNLTVSSSVLTGGVSGAAVYLGPGDGGQIVLSTNTLFGGRYALFAAAPAAGSGVWIASNTIVPAVAPGGSSYGIYLTGLTGGATVQNNGVYYRGQATAGLYTTLGLYAKSSPGLNIRNNRFSDPGALTGGGFAGVTLDGSVNAAVSFNDVYSTGTGLSNAHLLRVLNASTGAQVKNNIFYSSLTVTGSSATVLVDAASQPGFVSNYNDFFSSNGVNTGIWGGTSYQFLAGWKTATLNDANSISADPLFGNPGLENFHPHSVQGRCALALPYAATVPPSCNTYSVDADHSKTIDAGDPAQGYGLEPIPGGRRVNLGSYGNTAEASKSRRKLQVIVVN